jgi:hypothetical protein
MNQAFNSISLSIPRYSLTLNLPMKPRSLPLHLLAVVLTALLLATAFNAHPKTLYVNATNLAAASPYTNWDSAAKTIQDAVNAAADWDDILVTNGLYNTGGPWDATHRVYASKPVNLKSVNGPQFTIIQGKTNSTRNVRCVYLGRGGNIDGFTLTNGAATSGGGVYGARTSIVANCTFVGNFAGSAGGGVAYAIVTNCTFMGNSAGSGGGVAYAIVTNCTFITNNAISGEGAGGGAAFSSDLLNCTFIANSSYDGGGAYNCNLTNCLFLTNSCSNKGAGAYSCKLRYCTFSGNVSAYSGGGTWDSDGADCTYTGNQAPRGGGADNGTLTRCFFYGNSASDWGAATYYGTFFNCLIQNNTNSGKLAGGSYASWLVNCIIMGNECAGTNGTAGGAYLSWLNNCLVISNKATLYGGGIVRSTTGNSIVLFNDAPTYPNYFISTDINPPGSILGSLDFCCTTPLPTAGRGNLDTDPLFVDLATGNFRLQPNSPCINAGNNSYLNIRWGEFTNVFDMDANPRVQGGTADIGAYEFQNPGSTISYAWLQQYGLPIDGSADSLDPDSDHFTNYQEWIAGTNPTNSASALVLLAPTNTPSGMALTWTSVADRIYSVEQATNPAAPFTFSLLQTNITGLPGTTSLTDTNSPNVGQSVYRVSAQR